MFRTLSCRSELLHGVLAANHIGFHLFEYARHFITTCRRLESLRAEYTRFMAHIVNKKGSRVNITVSHVGIEPDLLSDALRRDGYVASLRVYCCAVWQASSSLDSLATLDRFVLVRFGLGWWVAVCNGLSVKCTTALLGVLSSRVWNPST